MNRGVDEEATAYEIWRKSISGYPEAHMGGTNLDGLIRPACYDARVAFGECPESDGELGGH